MKLVIPWRLFFNAFSKQPLAQRQSWLEYFKFDDSGVELIPEFDLPEAKNPRNMPLSEFERAVLCAIAEPNRPRLLHS
jgi:hypothetical protein